MASSPLLERTLDGVLSLPFASPSALVLQHAQLPESREILIIAHRHHLGLVEAIAQREGARADSIAREHARLSLTNLEIVLSHRGLIDQVPGASLLALPGKPLDDGASASLATRATVPEAT